MKENSHPYEINFLEISLSIGNNLDKKEMLEQALAVYTNELNAIWGAIIRVYDISIENINQNPINIYPTNTNPTSILNEIQQQLDIIEVAKQKLPVVTELPEGFLVLMDLSGYGLLALMLKQNINQKDLETLDKINLKLAQSALLCLDYEAQNNERNNYKNFVEQTPEIAFDVATDGTFRYLNAEGMQLLGYDPISLKEGKYNLISIFAPEDKDRAQMNFNRSTKEHIPFPREYTVVDKAGKKYTVLIYTRPITNSDNEIVGIRGFALDITERKSQENLIQESRERVDMALTGSEAGLWDWNIKTGDTYYNNRWANMLGYNLIEINKKVSFWNDLLHPDDKERVYEELQKHLNGETVIYKSEHRLKTKNGEWKWILDTGRVTERDMEGKPLRAVGTHIDITDRKEAEESLRKNLRQQEIISEIATSFNTLDNFEEKIQSALQKVGEHLDVSRVYIFEDNATGETTSNTFEWHNKGISPEKEHLQNLSYEATPSWKRILKEKGMLFSNDTSTLPDDIRAITDKEEILSIIEYPIYIEGKYYGFIGFDECIYHREWNKWELEMLRTIAGIISNSFERRKIEASLRRNDEKFKGFFNLTPVGLAVNDFHTGAFLECNEALLKQLGYSKEELRELEYWDITPKEFEHQEVQQIEFLKKMGKYGPYAKEYIRKSGERYPVLLSGFLAKDDEGNDVIWSEIQDISDIRKRDIEIQRNEEKFRGLFELSSYGIMLTDLDGIIIDCNTAFANLLCSHREQLLAKGLYEFMEPNEYHEKKQFVYQCYKENRILDTFEINIYTKEGKLIIAEINGFFSTNEEGKTVIWATIYDITEDRRKQEALIQSEEKFRHLFEFTPYGIVMTNWEGTFFDFNKAFTEMLGFSSSELLQKSFEDIAIPEEYNKNVPNLLKETAEKGYFSPFEAHLKKKDGSLIACHMQGFSLNPKENQPTIWISIQDVTEEHRKKEELQFSEKRFRQLFEQYPYGISITTLHGDLVDCNDALIRITGYSKDDLKQRLPYTNKNTREHSKIKTSITKDILSKGVFGPIEIPLKKRNGETMSCILQGFSFVDKDAETRIYTSIQDVSKEKEKAEAIRISEEKFRSLFELSPIGIVMRDLDTFEFIEVNNAFRNMLGYTAEEFKNVTYWDVSLDEYLSLEREVAQKLSRTRTFDSFEKEFKAKDGRRIPVLTTGFITQDETGRNIVWSSIQDISEIKNKTAGLKASEEKFRGLFEQIPIGVAKTDFHTSKYTECNNAFLKMLGYSADEIIGKTFLDITPEGYESLDDNIYQELAQKGEFGPYEKVYIKKNGEKLPVVINGYLTNDVNQTPLVWTTIQDISVLKKNERELRQSEEKFRSFVENASDVILALSLQGHTLYVSPNIEKMLGYKQDEIINHPMHEYVHPEDLQSYLMQVKDYLVRGLPSENMEYRIRHKNGEWRWVQVTTSINRDSNQNLYGIAILRDFTKDKLAQNELKRLSLVASQSTNIIVITNANREVEWVNDAFTKLTGYTKEEVVGKNPGTFLQGPLTSKRDLERIHEGLLSGKPFKAEVYNYSKNGRGYWVEVYITPTYGEKGELQSYIAVENDITERKHSEEQILKLTKGIENSPTVVVITDSNGVIEYVNNRFTEVTGYTPQETQGHTPRILKSGFHNRKFYKDLWDTIKAGNNWVGEIYNTKKDGTYYWESATISPIMNADNEITHFIALKEDITDRKLMYDEMLETLDRAEQATRAKSEFLATMSHEIRTPMNGVIGMTSLLAKTKLTDEQLDYVNTIRNSGDALLTIINDILDFSKIESGRMELELHPFDIRQCIEDVVDLFWLKSTQKGISLTYSISPSIKHKVLGDVTRVRQILVNLVGNAIKFTEEGGIHIDVKLKRKDKATKTSEITFSVKDSGLGIPGDKLSKLFTPFTQVDSSITRRFGGTGLGLAITSRLLELMSSHIYVDSQEGNGSNFYFTLNLKNTDITDCTIIPINLKKNKVYLSISNASIKTTLSNILDSINLNIVDTPTEATIIFSERCQAESESARTIFVNAINKNCNHPELDTQLMLPLKTSAVINALVKHSIIVDNSSKEENTDKETKLLAERYPISILVAEDNTINQKLMNKSLSFYGYSADIAANGLEVLEALERQPYDLIFMDLQMPEMDGLEATKQIISRYKEYRPKIVAMTASALGADKEACFEAGMDDYVSKPIKIDIIEEMIIKWCSTNS